MLLFEQSNLFGQSATSEKACIYLCIKRYGNNVAELTLYLTEFAPAQ